MRFVLAATFALMGFPTTGSSASIVRDPVRGRQVYATCAACHSLQPNVNMTGPSLAGCGTERRELFQIFPAIHAH